MMDVSLTLSESQLAKLEAVLFPGDELEAAAVVLCGRHEHGGRHRLVGHRVVPVPDNQYERREHDLVAWKTGFLQPLLLLPPLTRGGLLLHP